MKYTLILVWFSFFYFNVKAQTINWATETGLSNGDSFVDGQVITNFAGTGLDARINVVAEGADPRISGGTRVIIGAKVNCSFTLTFLNGRVDVLLNNHQNLQKGEIMTLSNPDGQKISLQQTSNNGGGRMTVDGTTVPALNAVVDAGSTTVVREVNNGAGTSWNARMEWVSSFTWAYGSGPGTSATEGFQLTISNISPLPVSFNSMNVSTDANKNVLIEWETASEINNDYFIIERSLDASVWNEIGKIEGSGNSNNTIKYSLLNKNPVLGNTYYYRVKQIDFDGKFSYGKIKSIQIEKESGSVLVYPNPVSNNNLTVELLDGGNLKFLEIYDNVGRKVTHSINIFSEEGQKLELDVSKLKTGIYYIKTREITTKLFVER